MSISQTLSIISQSKEWDQQLQSLKNLPICEETAKKLNNSKNSSIIIDLLGNPKSKVITSTCLFLSELCEKYGTLMHPFVGFFIGNQVGFRLLGAANKVIAQEVHELFKTIILSSPNPKMYISFAREMTNKSCQVREFVSSYLLVLSDCVEFPQNLVSCLSNWKNDASKTVRQNIRNLQYIIMNKRTNKNKQNLAPRHGSKPLKPIQQNSQVIIDSFLTSAEQSISHEDDLSSNIDFLFSKINNNQPWSMKQYAIGELCTIFDRTELQDSQALKFVEAFFQLLDQKRSKINSIMCLMFCKALLAYQFVTIHYLEANFTDFVEKALRIQQGAQLVSKTIKLDPQKYLIHLAQSTVDIKSVKQKATALDLLVQLICQYELPPSKIPVIIKLLCKHFQKYHSSKEIYLPSLAIVSHFKIQHPSELLACLICLDKPTLTRIIECAELVDPNLRQAIVNYIHSMKNCCEKQQKKQQISDTFAFKNSKLEQLLNKIQNEEEDAVTKLVEYIFHSKQHNITIRQFYEIIKLTQKVVTKNTLLELQLLLQQICKSHNQNFLQALFQAVASCDGNTIESEYILAYLRKIQTLLHNWSWMMHQKHAQKLISIYRFNKCPKIRLLSIKILSLFPIELSGQYTNQKQRKLIQSQQHLEKQAQDSK